MWVCVPHLSPGDLGRPVQKCRNGREWPVTWWGWDLGRCGEWLFRVWGHTHPKHQTPILPKLPQHPTNKPSRFLHFSATHCCPPRPLRPAALLHPLMLALPTMPWFEFSRARKPSIQTCQCNWEKVEKFGVGGRREWTVRGAVDEDEGRFERRFGETLGNTGFFWIA